MAANRAILIVVAPLLIFGQNQSTVFDDPKASLRQALTFADAYNWYDAGPHFLAAEKYAVSVGDARSELYARVGTIRSTMEQRVLPETALLLDGELKQNALLQNDSALRMFVLQVKGDIDFELDASIASRDWQEVLTIATKAGDAKWQRRAKGELGLTAFVEGDILTARKLVGTALVEATLAGDAGAQVRYLAAIGTALGLMKNFDQSLERLNQAIAIAEKNPVIGYSFPTQEAKIQALAGMNRITEAFALANEVVLEAQRKKRFVKEAQAYNTMGNMALRANDLKRAEEFLRQAADLSERGGFTRLQAGSYNDLSLLKRKSGDRDGAEHFASRAAELTQTSGDLFILPDRLLSLAAAQEARADFVGARDTLARATEVVDVIVSSTSVPSVRAALVHSMSAIYAANFLLHAKHLKDIDGAWRVLEASRARTTRDLLHQNKSSPARLTREISTLRLEFLKAKSVKQFREIREKVFLAEARELAEPDNPFFGRGEPITIPELQSRLGVDELLLEFALGEEASYCFAITRLSARLVPLPPASELDHLLSSYHDSLKKKEIAAIAARALFRKLLGPVHAEVAAKKTLLIARHGTLHLIPIESLIAPDGRYVIQTHTVAYVPSGTTYALLRQRSRQASRELSFLGVGDIPYDASPLPKIAATRGYETRLGNLPNSADEIDIAAKTLRASIPKMSATLLVGSAATEAAFKSIAGKNQIIHLAVHAKANNVRPAEAALILLSDAKAGEDGFLQANEVLELRLNADLVLLSACDTAVGKLLGEDGIANLARSFLAAGAQTVVSTLWEADDVFASSLIRKFYLYLGRGQSASVAMASAKRELIGTIGKRAVPWLWAPYIVEGADTFRLTASKGEGGAK